MRSSYKRLLAAALSGLLLLSCAACAQTGDTDADTTASATTEEVDTNAHLYADLPTDNYNGYEFNVLQYKEETAATATVLTERTGNPIEDKIYERAIAVEERLKIKFVNHLDSLDGVSASLRNNIAGGMDEYDVCWTHSTTTVSNFLAPGYLLDLNNVEGLNFDKPWWDDTANDYLALDEHMYMAFGDINVYLYDFHSAILFNKDVTDKSQINLYNMVEDGTWTMDKFITLATELALPAADGSSTYDRMGYTGTAPATLFGFIHGADAQLFTYNDEGIPQMSMANLQGTLIPDIIQLYHFQMREITRYVRMLKIAQPRHYYIPNNEDFNRTYSFIHSCIIPLIIALKFHNVNLYHDFIDGKDATPMNVFKTDRGARLIAYFLLDKRGVVDMPMLDQYLTELYNALFVNKSVNQNVEVGNITISPEIQTEMFETISLLSRISAYE